MQDKHVIVGIGFAILLFTASSVIYKQWNDAYTNDTLALATRRSLSLNPFAHILSHSSYLADPKTVVGKNWRNTTIQDDGTWLLFWDDHYFWGQYGREAIKNQDRIKRIHYHVFSCKSFDDSFGNSLSVMYGIRMLANSLQVPFQFTCEMGKGETANGAAFLMHHNSLNSDVIGQPIKDPTSENFLTIEDVGKLCNQNICYWQSRGLQLASDLMISDWNQFSDPSALPIQDHDDAVIHLRLGDTMYSFDGMFHGKGLLPHSLYVKLLMQAQEEMGAIHSIGVVTAPFNGSYVRNKDRGIKKLSETVAVDLLKYLEKAFPQAVVRLHNDQNETIIESLSRVARARKVAVCGCSSFCPYPLLAQSTRGIGYMFKPLGFDNNWVPFVANRYKNFRLFSSPMLKSVTIDNLKTKKKLSEEEVMTWLRNQDPE